MEEISVFYCIIKDLFDGRVYPEMIPATNSAADPMQWPAIRYSFLPGKVYLTNSYQSYSPRVQIDIYADSPEERAQAVELVINVIKSSDEIECILKTAPTSFYDEERKKYQATFDYLIN